MEKSYLSPRLTVEQKERISELYKSGVCPLRISRELGVTTKTIYTHLDKLGLRPKGSKQSSIRKYYINESYFDVLDNTEKAYWLGYLAARCISDNKNIIIEASGKDIVHLERLLISIGSTYPVHHKMNDSYITYYVKIYAPYWIKQINKYNRRTSKSKLNMWPNNIDDKYISHYIRGYFDDKGYWGINNTFSLRGTSFRFMDKLNRHLIKECNLKPRDLIKTPTGYCIKYTGKLQCKRLFDYIYNESTMHLERKFLKIERLWDDEHV